MQKCFKIFIECQRIICKDNNALSFVNKINNNE